MAESPDPKPVVKLAWWQRVFAVDYRSMAALRIGLGILVLLDVRLRWPIITEMYSDSGYFTRELATKYFDKFANFPWRKLIWSVHMLDGSVEWAETLFVAEVVLGLMLIFGCLTRLVTFLLWILIASVHARNPIIISSADMLLKLMLFWSILLPLGRVWSIDSWIWKRGRPSGVYCSVTSAGFILQFVLMYFFTGLAKWNEVWLSGTAMQYVMRLDIYATPFGRSLLDKPLVPEFIDYSTLVMEVGAVWLIFLPWRNTVFRVLLILAYWGFHFGISLSMSIGLFSWICMAAWLILIPTGFWNWFDRSVQTNSGERERGRPGLGFRLVRIGVNAFAGLMILLAVMWNVCNMDFPKYAWILPSPMEGLGRLLAFEQHFQMFGKPPKESPWFVYHSWLKNGEEVDIFRGGKPVDASRPERINLTFPDHNYRKLHRNLISDRLGDFRQPLLESIVRKWNAEHSEDEQVISVELIAFYEPIGPKYNGVDRWSRTWATWRAPDLKEGWRFELMRRRLKNRTGPAF